MRSGKAEHAAADLSALLDRELDAERARQVSAHLDSCDHCRREMEEITRVRRVLRTTPVTNVPDLVGPILDRVPADRRRTSGRELRARLRVAAVAAAVTAVVLIGAWLPGENEPAQSALAATVVQEVRTGARALDTYRATFSIQERGWHEDVPIRSFSAEVAFGAPESYALSIVDHTDYPAGEWPANDVDLIANPRAWWMSEPSTCPPSALPGCLGAGVDREQRGLLHRRPFDGTIALPTDLVLPLQTLADNPRFEVAGTTTMQGRSAIHIVLPLWEALPLVSSLQTGGSWRAFYPGDRVDLWIDADTAFPLRFEVRADTSAARATWARAEGYRDAAGDVLLQVTTTDFSEPSGFPPATFRVPQRGTIADARFEPIPFARVARDLAPRKTYGLRPFRAGRTGDQTTLSYSLGMTWLKVTHDPGAAATTDPSAEEIALGGGRWAYYQPATSVRGRSVELLDDDGHVLVESNLPREDVLEIATTVRVAARKAARRSGGAGGLKVTRVDVSDLDALGFGPLPTNLTEGYRAAAAYTSVTPGASRSITVLYRRAEAEYDGLGIRVKRSHGVDVLPPSPEDALDLVQDGINMRWFPRRGEIDWLDDGVYTSVSAPSFPRSILLGIAAELS